MDLIDPMSNPDRGSALKAVTSEFPTVTDFEHPFPSLCFALATGVGKTRLMGAFVSYLYRAHGIRNFFVLVPNLTIYRKLTDDFTLNTPKYVFRGISEFSVKPPALITGDNYEERAHVLDMFDHDDVVVNIFNISKFNARTKDARRMRRLSEYLGQSYFDYLSGLDDLVILMDEAHRYRADASMKAIAELNPILGLELTATPQIESGKSAGRFKNVIYNYPLPMAMRDGYVKEPAVATRANFDPTSISETAMEQLKLEDGIRVHEATKVDLDIYAHENRLPRVKPFMLVIAKDTTHAEKLVQAMEAAQFFDGRYKGRVTLVHSAQKGAEKDENIERLLAVEDPDEPTEIVVHVNMLKEGWDVTNLYTIVPLRAADSKTLVEQSIGRGLRLPFGKRTGVPAVDRLTIVAHDRFQDIVDEAKRGGFSFTEVHIGTDIPEIAHQSIIVAPAVETLLGLSPAALEGSGGRPTDASSANPAEQLNAAIPAPLFKLPAEVEAAGYALDAIRQAVKNTNVAPSPAALESEGVQAHLVAQVTAQIESGQQTLFTPVDPKRLKSLVKETTAAYVSHTIAIPRVIVLPKGEVRAGFHEFTADLSSFRQPPVAKEIIVKHLASDQTEVIGALEGGHEEERLEDYVVRGLIDFDDVYYEEQAELLYSLAGQVVTHLRGYLKDDDEVRNVLIFHQRRIADLVHSQMQSHGWETAGSYEATVSQGFMEIRSQAFAAPASESIRPFDTPIAKKSAIRSMLFGDFKRCLYPTQKFDTDSERRFAVILETDDTCLKWFKPAKGIFRIRYSDEHDYEPDFVVETSSQKLICEPKRADQKTDPVVLSKAQAAATWCKHASAYEALHGGKPWSYLLIPHDVIADNMTIQGLAKSYLVIPNDDAGTA